ncbi:peptide/nickel transport system permease protein [Gemmobacter megaterium]|uniref:Peptide/nickel transport system permease protein n=1 Tax=Gemmobacter megaterium TaxID=1086013 RepID=A0A1N7N2K3_9RHOB|nr:nickel ABC transporter permease [Gemmobacter megaterium]GGE12702.1 peptide ABC transporter permease [Gemmobacter megaterium]SIS92643.1 peptide/nickel transport system permease protein [Gemmobacter megaterium]
MSRYLLRRLLHAVLIVAGISVISFFFLHLTGDPVGLILPQDATREQIETLRRDLLLDEPIHVQYLHFVASALQGDMGRSIYTREPVLGLILERLPATLELALTALVLSLIIAIPMGVIAALRRGGWLDTISMTLALFGLSMPHFWLGIMLIMLFSVQLNWLPTSGRGTWEQLIMPSVALGASLVALFARLTRSAMLEVLGQDYVRTARAKGLTETVVVGKHALRNALIPLVTVAAMEFGFLLGGAVIIETVFAWPGVGRLIVQSILDRDYPVVQAAVMMLAIVFVVVNLVVDLLYTWLDPNISLGRTDQ